MLIVFFWIRRIEYLLRSLRNGWSAFLCFRPWSINVASSVVLFFLLLFGLILTICRPGRHSGSVFIFFSGCLLFFLHSLIRIAAYLLRLQYLLPFPCLLTNTGVGASSGIFFTLVLSLFRLAVILAQLHLFYLLWFLHDQRLLLWVFFSAFVRWFSWGSGFVCFDCSKNSSDIKYW